MSAERRFTSKINMRDPGLSLILSGDRVAIEQAGDRSRELSILCFQIGWQEQAQLTRRGMMNRKLLSTRRI